MSFGSSFFKIPIIVPRIPVYCKRKIICYYKSTKDRYEEKLLRYQPFVHTQYKDSFKEGKR